MTKKWNFWEILVSNFAQTDTVNNYLLWVWQAINVTYITTTFNPIRTITWHITTNKKQPLNSTIIMKNINFKTKNKIITYISKNRSFPIHKTVVIRIKLSVLQTQNLIQTIIYKSIKKRRPGMHLRLPRRQYTHEVPSWNMIILY